LISVLIFIISLLFVLGFACACFSRSLRCSIRSLFEFFQSLIYALMAVNFSVRTAFDVPHRFW
jgi:hypothetical protein